MNSNNDIFNPMYKKNEKKMIIAYLILLTKKKVRRLPK